MSPTRAREFVVARFMRLLKKAFEKEILECSPSFGKLRTVSKVEPLGEPFESPSFSRGFRSS
jgi:hypothetical protein